MVHKRPRPEDHPPHHPIHKDRITYCTDCHGTGQIQEHRSRGVCSTCVGRGSVSKDSKGRTIAWTRKGWIVRP